MTGHLLTPNYRALFAETAVDTGPRVGLEQRRVLWFTQHVHHAAVPLMGHYGIIPEHPPTGQMFSNRK